MFDNWNYDDGFDGHIGEREFCRDEVIIDRVASKTVPVAIEFERVHKHMFETREPLPPRRLKMRPVRRNCGYGYGYENGYGYGRCGQGRNW